MARIMSMTKFSYPAPHPNEIVKMASEITGLTVQFQANDNIAAFNEYSGEIYFEILPEEKVKLYSYQMCAIKELEDKSSKETGYESPFKPLGYDDCNGVQRVYVDGILGQEVTILNVATVALMKLGGELEDSYYELSEYDSQITEEELKQRVLKHYKKMKPIFLMQKVWGFIALPLIVIYTIISTPYFLFVTYKNLLKRLWKGNH